MKNIWHRLCYRFSTKYRARIDGEYFHKKLHNAVMKDFDPLAFDDGGWVPDRRNMSGSI